MTHLKQLFKNTSALNFATRLKSFKANKDGVAAIEFAILAPILIFMYLGLAEVSTAIAVDRNVSHSTNVAGDLVTREDTISADYMGDILTATIAVMGVPQSQIDKVWVEISSYRCLDEDANTWELEGSATMTGAQSTAGSTYDPAPLIPDLLNETTGAVVARVHYDYTPVSQNYMSQVTLKETFVLKPRGPNVVDFDGSVGVTFTCSVQPSMDVTCT